MTDSYRGCGAALPALLAWFLLLSAPGASGNDDAGAATSATAVAAPSEDAALAVYKSPTCGCCVKWIDGLNAQGLRTVVQHPDDLDAIKARLGIAPVYRSCHTAVSKQGYFFEGHVPAKFIRRFLAERPPGATGLTVPGMPVGSPGMEVDDKFMPYEVWMLKADGTKETYAVIQSPADQAP
jgi:hypothetical protein